MNGGKNGRFIRRTAKEIKTYRHKVRLLPKVIVTLLLLLLLTFSVSGIARAQNSFTVSTTLGKQGLMLSDNVDFYNSTAFLDVDIDKRITNISKKTLPTNLDQVDGVHNGKNHLAYTFYCRNSGKEKVNYTYTLYMQAATKGLDEAIRIRLYVDGVATDFAKEAKDGQPEPETTPFLSDKIIANGQINDFEVGENTKYTIVVWLEGDDPECVDDVIGGKISLSMELQIIE